MDVGSASIIATEIRNTIDNFEPRVQLMDVQVTPYYDSHAYDVTIVYEIVGIDVPAQQVNFLLESLR
jgi:predicted component of type VI protein secretion system